MAKRQQNVVSWAASMVQLGMGLAGFLDAAGKGIAASKGNKWGTFRANVLANYTGVITKVSGEYVDFDPMRAWGTMSAVGGVLAGKVIRMANKGGGMRTILPKF